MKRYTVLMLSNLYPPVVSGSSTQAAALSRELVMRGHRVIVVTARLGGSSPELEEDCGVIIHRLPAFRLPKLALSFNFPWLSYTFTVANIRRIQGLIRQSNPDVIHLHNHMFDLGLSAAVLRKGLKIPLVITLHTVLRHSSRLYNMLLLPVDRFVLRKLVVDNADQLVCPDLNIQRYAQEIFGRSDAVIVPYGIDTDQQVDPQEVNRICEKYALAGRRVILSLGHVHEIRNRKDLILALPHVLRIFPQAILLLIGLVSTDLPARLSRKLGLEHAIVFIGPVDHKDVRVFLALADLEAHWLNQESPDKTSLGIASLEAMAAGKTVLSAANPDTYGEGILRHGENVILVDPEKPEELARTIMELLGDDERRAEIGARARRTILDHFSWDRVCQRTIQVYESVINRK